MLPRLMVVLLGSLLLSALVWQLATLRPFESAPVVALPPRAHADRVAGTLGSAARPQLPVVPSPTEQAPTPPLDETENLLLAGIDTRPDHAGGRTDALVLVVIDRRSGHVGLVAIPRDLAVNLAGHGVVRLNTVYLRGSREGGPQRGAALLREVIHHLLGLRVDHLVFVDHAGFEALVDALGGIPVQVVCPIQDRFIDPRGPDGRLELKLEAGVRWLDGRTALMFARSRHGRGITDRARRQQAVLLGLRERLAELGPTRALELLPLLRRTIYADIEAAEVVRLARLLARMERGRIHGLVLDHRHAEPTVLADGRWTMLPKPDAIHVALVELFRAGPPGFRRPETCPPADAALRRPAGAATPRGRAP